MFAEPCAVQKRPPHPPPGDSPRTKRRYVAIYRASLSRASHPPTTQYHGSLLSAPRKSQPTTRPETVGRKERGGFAPCRASGLNLFALQLYAVLLYLPSIVQLSDSCHPPTNNYLHNQVRPHFRPPTKESSEIQPRHLARQWPHPTSRTTDSSMRLCYATPS